MVSIVSMVLIRFQMHLLFECHWQALSCHCFKLHSSNSVAFSWAAHRQWNSVSQLRKAQIKGPLLPKHEYCQGRTEHANEDKDIDCGFKYAQLLSRPHGNQSVGICMCDEWRKCQFDDDLDDGQWMARAHLLCTWITRLKYTHLGCESGTFPFPFPSSSASSNRSNYLIIGSFHHLWLTK